MKFALYPFATLLLGLGCSQYTTAKTWADTVCDVVLSGRRYETRNPYTVYEVKQAIVALGGLNGYDLPPRIRKRMRMYSEG